MENEIMAKSKKTSTKSAKKPRKKAETPSQVTITYDLFDLPTAQHKAGLAGLLLQIESMSIRKPKLPAPRVVECSATSATVEFTEEAVQSLMKHLYDAENVRVKVKSKWPNTTPLAEDYVEETDEKGKKNVSRYSCMKCVNPKAIFFGDISTATRKYGINYGEICFGLFLAGIHNHASRMTNVLPVKHVRKDRRLGMIF
jgi:hypothetical protein